MPKNQDPVLEVCVESFFEAISAEQEGAHRLELCSSLHLDGLTPPIRLVENVVNGVDLPVKVMIRCRPGDFEYSEEELSHMADQMQILARLGISGFVFGALRGDQLDIEAIAKISRVIPEIPTTVHKAIDMTRDPVGSARSLLGVPGVDSILSSGGRGNAIDGIEVLNAMHQAVSPRLTLVAAGGITSSNLPRLMETLKTQEYHGRRIVANE